MAREMMRAPLKVAATAIAVLTGAFTLWIGADSHFARAGDVKQQIDELRMLHLEQAHRELSREKFTFEVARETRTLSTLELQRYQDVKDGLLRLDQILKGIRK